jgi:hypothetical protein
MAQNNGSNNGPALWLIIPVAAFLTLLLVKANHATTARNEQLPGARPEAKKEVIAPDTTKTKAVPDTTHTEGMH